MGEAWGVVLRRLRLPAPGRVGRSALLREGALWALPALAGLAALLLAGLVRPLHAAVGLLAAVPVAAWLAAARLRELEAVAAWVERLVAAEQAGGNGAEPAAVEAEGEVADRLVRPVAGLARRFRRQGRRLAAQQRMLASVIEAVPDPVLLVDAGLTVTRANAAARRGFGVEAGREAEGGLPLARVLRDPGVLAAVGGTLRSGAASSVAFSPALDRAKRFSARVEPVELGESGGRGALVTLREQTEQVMIERMRSDFVANASHEIRNPLAAIQGIVETLRGPARHDAQAREMFLEVMAGEAGRMARLVDDLLSLSRTELAAHQPPTERCDPAAVVGQVLERTRRAAAGTGVTIEAEVADGLPELVADADQLHQLLVNLIDNAAKYGGEGKTVRVAAAFVPAAPADAGPAAGRPCVRVAVRDEGPGIAKEHIPRLTERFYRVDTARSRATRGTGLGLAIVKHILRRHQGHLAVASEPGRGSEFAVYLPVADATNAA